MTIDRTTEYLLSLLNELCKLPQEAEWVEFKHNNDDPEQIGEYLSALANAAALLGKVHAYLFWGVDDRTHEVLSEPPSTPPVPGSVTKSWKVGCYDCLTQK